MDKFQTLREKDNPSNNVYPNIQGQNIPSSAVTTDKIADDAITRAKIASKAISSSEIDDGGVSATNLASNSVTTAKISSGAVTTSKIDAGAVTTAKIDTGAVTTAKLGAGAVTSDKLGADSVTIEKFKYSLINLKTYYNDNALDYASFKSWLGSIVGCTSPHYLLLRSFYQDILNDDFEDVRFEVHTGNFRVSWESDDLTITNQTEMDNFIANYAGYIFLAVLGE